MTHRFFVPNLPESGAVILDGPEAHHLTHVLRAANGEIAELFNGAGLVARAEIAAVRKRDAELRILECRREDRPDREIVIATAFPKGDRLDWLIEKATELGVSRLIPLVTARSVVDPRESKLEKLRQNVVAACKQCHRNYLLEISPVAAWNDFVKNEIGNAKTFIAHPAPGATPFSAELAGGLATTLFAIGPEGGFTDGEVSLAVENGATAIQLGPLVLRIETAVLAVAASGIIKNPG